MKILYIISLGILKFTCCFWLLYSIIYQFIDGPHWKAISPNEIWLDSVMNLFFSTGILLWCIPVFTKINEIMIKDLKDED